MATILRSVGLGLRVVGSLKLSNNVLNPKFEQYSGGFTNWTSFGRATASVDTTHVAHGTKSCLLTITSGTAQDNGIKQTNIPIIGGAWYTVSADFYVGTALPNAIRSRIVLYDLNNVQVDFFELDMVTGAATAPNFVRASYSVGIHPQAVTAELQFKTFSSTAQNFNLDGVRLVQIPDALTPDAAYRDGDYSGYVWADQPDLSTTLQSTPPDALNFFATGGPVTPTPVVS